MLLLVISSMATTIMCVISLIFTNQCAACNCGRGSQRQWQQISVFSAVAAAPAGQASRLAKPHSRSMLRQHLMPAAPSSVHSRHRPFSRQSTLRIHLTWHEWQPRT